MKLYEVKNDYLEKLQSIEENGINLETGEITEDQNQIAIWKEEIKTDLISKSQNVIAVFKNSEANLKLIDEEIERLIKIKEVKEKYHKRFEEYIKNILLETGIEKIETPIGTITFTNSTSTEIYDETLIDKKFIKEVKKTTISKIDIRKALQAGEEVQGARLVNNKNMKIN